MAALYSTGVFDRNNNIAQDWAATKSRRINVLRLLLWNPMDTFSLGNQRMAVDAHLAACGRAGVLADHVTAVPENPIKKAGLTPAFFFNYSRPICPSAPLLHR